MARTGSGVQRGDREAWRRLAEFRASWYGCLCPWGDALFGLTDAVACAGGPVTSLARLSLLPVFGRGHGSAYAALAEGRIDAEGLRDLLAAARPPCWPLVFAVDGTSWPRCDAETSPQRGYYYHPSRHSAGKPIVAGWWYQQISQLNFGKDSWTWPVDCRRIQPLDDQVTATAGQVRDLLSRLGPTAVVPLFAFDGGYDPIALADELCRENAQILVRIKGDRVFYADPPARAAGGRGRPRRHGARFDCKKPATWGPPQVQLAARDGAYGTVTVAAWAGLHPQLAARGRWAGRGQPPIVRGWVIRIDVEHLPRPTRAKRSYGCGGPGRPAWPRTWTCAGGPTSTGSTSSTPSSSARPPWAGSLRRCGYPGRPTGGPRSSSPATPSWSSPGRWPPTSACPGNGPGPGPAHPRPGAPRFSACSRALARASQPQKILHRRTRTAQGQHHRPSPALSSDQKAA
jgi:hypothetical protein